MGHFRLRLLTAVATLLALSFAGGANAAPSELFFSEYIEGTSNNKALEIYNGTGAPVNLAAAGYNVQMFFNGSVTAGPTINLTGTVAAGDVFVLAQSTADAAILGPGRPDERPPAGSTATTPSSLRKGTTVLDSSARSASTPGTEWGTGLTEHRGQHAAPQGCPSTAGDTNGSDAFDPAVEWDGFATDTFDGLGSHTVDGGPATDAAPSVTATTPADGAATSAVDAARGHLHRAGQRRGGAFTLVVLGHRHQDRSPSPAARRRSRSTRQPTSPLGDAVHADRRSAPASPTRTPSTRRTRMAARRHVTLLDDRHRPVRARDHPDPGDPGQRRHRGDHGRGHDARRRRRRLRGPEPGAARLLPPGPRPATATPRPPTAIFVFDGSNANSVNLGDLVTVTGNAGENQGQTQISATQVDGLRHRLGRPDRRDASRCRPAPSSSATRACSCACRRRCP